MPEATGPPHPLPKGLPLMQSRRQFFAQCSGATALALAALAGHAGAQLPRSPALLERLLVGLRVRTTSDRAFVARVVQLVQLGRLPLRLVDTTYLWARKKAAKNRYSANNPMIYFRPAMTVRAKKLGVTI
jgi:hypothetical protein